VRYDEDDLNRIHVMDEAGRFICMADKRTLGTWKMDSDEYRKHMRMKKAVKESIMPYADISKSLSAADREMLFIGLIKDSGAQLPAAPERRVDTPFRMILENDKAQREESRRLEAGAQEYLHRFVDAEVDADETESQIIRRRVDDFFSKSYRRNS
jgi:hypothetical protein